MCRQSEMGWHSLHASVLTKARCWRVIGKARVTQAGSNGEDSPPPHVLHEGDLAETLHDGVVVHQSHRLLSADLRNRPTEAGWKIETIALSIAWKVLSAPIDTAVRLDVARTPDTDERSQP